VDPPLELPRYAPGLHLETAPLPLVRAQQLAEELSGHLCTTADEADALLEDLSTLPPLEADALSLLAALAAKVQVAERIVGRTVDRAAESVGERLAATGTGMAVHPTAVRDRAAVVLAAREVVAAAEDRLRLAEREADEERSAAAARAAAQEPDVPAPEPVAPVADEPPARRRRFAFRRNRVEDGDTSESTRLLQQMAAATDEAFGQRRAARARDDQLLLLQAERDRAMEEVRVAERSWRDLAGDDPVEDLEAVVRRFDPQHQDALAVAHETVGVRAVSTLLSLARARWTDGWRSVGFDEPMVESGAMDAVVARGVSPVVLAGGAVERADAIVAAAPAAPVLVVEAGQPSG
jgi:hypothetical protein